MKVVVPLGLIHGSSRERLLPGRSIHIDFCKAAARCQSIGTLCTNRSVAPATDRGQVTASHRITCRRAFLARKSQLEASSRMGILLSICRYSVSLFAMFRRFPCRPFRRLIAAPSVLSTVLFGVFRWRQMAEEGHHGGRTPPLSSPPPFPTFPSPIRNDGTGASVQRRKPPPNLCRAVI